MEQTPDEFARSLQAVAGRVAKEVRDVVAKGANNIKRDARENVGRSAPIHNAHAQYAITYDDPTANGSVISSEIGYDKELRGGSLGNLLEYGSRNNSPHRDLGRAFDAETPRFEQHLADIAMRLLE
jgi:hypothetical protein